MGRLSGPRDVPPRILRDCPACGKPAAERDLGRRQAYSRGEAYACCEHYKQTRELFRMQTDLDQFGNGRHGTYKGRWLWEPVVVKQRIEVGPPPARPPSTTAGLASLPASTTDGVACG